jgi:hypothetical protein
LRVANIALSGTVFEGLSYGGSRFVGLSDHKGAGQRPAFSIRKNHNPFQVTVHFHSETLIRFLWGCSDWPLGVLHSLHGCNITSILERFDDIQTCFDAIARSFNSESDTERATEMRELKLFVIDFLLDETILSGIDRIGPDLLSSRIRCHMWGHKVLIDIDTLEFALGLQRQVYDSGTWSSPIYSAVNHRLSSVTDGLHTVANSRSRLLKLIKFRTYFHKSFLTLQQHRAMCDISRFQIPADLRSAWRLGFRVIRDILRGKLPQNVQQVIFCVMMADAIREGTGFYQFTQKEYVSITEAV